MSDENPFHLISKIQSTIALADDCIEQMEHCCELHKKLTKLNECERKGDSTRVMLILAKYGSRTKFINTITNATSEFDRRLESLETQAREIQEIVETKSYQCPKCYGRGSLSRTEYVRERGFVHQVLRSHHCYDCNGKGQIAVSPVAESYLSLFLEMSNKLTLFLKHFRETLECFRCHLLKNST